MRTIAIAKLKATLSAELKYVRAGESITVLDRTTPIAVISPVPEPVLVSTPARKTYEYRDLGRLTDRDPMKSLEEERSDSR